MPKEGQSGNPGIQEKVIMCAGVKHWGNMNVSNLLNKLIICILLMSHPKSHQLLFLHILNWFKVIKMSQVLIFHIKWSNIFYTSGDFNVCSSGLLSLMLFVCFCAISQECQRMRPCQPTFQMLRKSSANMACKTCNNSLRIWINVKTHTKNVFRFFFFFCSWAGKLLSALSLAWFSNVLF